MKKTLLIIIILIAASAFLFYSKKESSLTNEKSKNPAAEEISTMTATANNTSISTTTEVEKKEEAPIVKKGVATSTPQIKITEINLDVPFSSQAPYSDWSEPYQNACEETASLMVAKYYQKATLTPAIAKEEILDLVAWQNKTFGYYEDTTAAETARILKEYYGFKRVEVIYDFSLADLKAEVLASRPVIIPASGQMLGNPNFKQPGPIYHMLVIKGLTENGDFITNDNGTRKGHNYVYKAEVLYKAIHDAPQGGHTINRADLDTNRKAMIIVYPN
ncbi:MAG: C39 family peptidase [Candidatus Falkowbacteria bacterium]|nr:MAG: C39 family peptidase [Candidatus Falkowbacteria bacterium]